MTGLLSVLGTAIPQGRQKSFYAEKYPFPVATLILASGIDDCATSAATLITVSLLFVNLLVCSATRLRNEYKSGNKSHGPDIIHLSLLLLIVGAYLSLALRSEELVYLSSGDSGRFSGGYSISLMDSKYSLYDDGRTKEWTSSVGIARGDEFPENYTIEVNRPAKLGNGRLYQVDYTPSDSASLVSGSGKEIRLEEGSIVDLGDDLYRFLGNGSEAGIEYARFEQFSGKRMVHSAKTGDSIGSYRLLAMSTRMMTGFNYVKDPGAGIVFISVFILAAGLAETVRKKLIGERT